MRERKLKMKYIGHGGKEILERILPPIEAKKRIKGLKRIEVTDRVTRNIEGILFCL